MKQIFILLLVSLVIVFYSCSKEGQLECSDETYLNTLNELETEDKIKVLVSKFLYAHVKSDHDFRSLLFDQLIIEKQTREFLWVRDAQKKLFNGKSLESLALDFYKEESYKYNLIKNIGTYLPNLVITIPEWVEIVFENNYDVSDLEFGLYPCIKNQTKDVFYYNLNSGLITGRNDFPTTLLSDLLPIQIKESEHLIPIIEGTSRTIWGDDFFENQFPTLLNCDEFEFANYTTYRFTNDAIDNAILFIDRFQLNDDLRQVVLCPFDPPVNPPNPSTDPCEIVYERDCIDEKNVIEGIELVSLAVLGFINNQPGGEEVMALHYNFVTPERCGPATESSVCSANVWKYVFVGRLTDFYELQLIKGSPTFEERGDLIYEGRKYYIKAFPKYYDIPVANSLEHIYTQAPYLSQTAHSTWDGNVYGDIVAFSVYEHDDVFVKSSGTQSVTVTLTNSSSNKVDDKGDEVTFKTGSDFSSTVKRTTSYSYSIESSKDVQLGQNTSLYYDRNYTTPDFYGINKTTGSVSTHFAFYED